MFISFCWLKFFTPMFRILRRFGVFTLAKYCGSFKKFDTYFLQSLDSSLKKVNLIRVGNESHLVGISLFCGGKALEKAKENVETRRKKRINPVALDMEDNNKDEVMADANKFSHRHALLCLWIYKRNTP